MNLKTHFLRTCFGIFAFATLFLFHTSVSAQTCSDPAVVKCILNSGHFDQNEKNLACYDDDLNEVWSIANEILITTILGDPTGDFVYTIGHEAVAVTQGGSYDVPLDTGDTILGGSDTGGNQIITALLIKDIDGKGSIHAFQNQSDGSLTYFGETPTSDHVTNPVWILGGSTSEMNGDVFVGTETEGIFKVDSSLGMSMFVDMMDIQALTNAEYPVLGAVQLMEANHSAGEYSIAFIVHDQEKSHIVRWDYFSNSQTSQLTLVVENIPFSAGGLIAAGTNLVVTSPDRGGIYSIQNLNVNSLPAQWSELESSATFNTVDIERPTLIVETTVCTDQIVRVKCIESVCDKDEKDCEYFQADDYMETDCSNECGEGITSCVIEDGELFYEECSAPNVDDINHNDIADCTEDPSVFEISEEPNVPGIADPVEVVEEDTPAVFAEETGDEPSIFENAESEVLLDGGYAFNGGMLGCSLNTRAQTGSSAFLSLSFVLSLASLLILRRKASH